MQGTIYKITNLVNKKIYIGQTTDTIEYRLQEHFWDAARWYANLNKKFNSRLYAAIIKYGNVNFIIEPLYEVADNEDIDQLEKYYISLYNAQNPKIGYNIAEGGNKPPSRLDWHPSAESKLKMSKAQKGKKWYNNGVNELMVLVGQDPPIGYNLGRIKGQGFKSGVANPSFGKHGTNYGKHLSADCKEKISQTKKIKNSKKQIVWYNNGLTEIQIDLNTDYEIPIGYVKGRLKSHLNINSKKQVEIIDIETDIKFICESCEQACKMLKVSAPTLIKACKTGYLIANKYKCSYLQDL